jgi:penicillin amidase
MDFDPAWLLRIFTIIPIVLVLLAGAAAIWIYFFVGSLLPESASAVDMPGLSADVRVVRDAHGVPGILGENEEDVALALGYVMAQDRLWQMDYLRRAGQGRLAEILGPEYLEGDHLMRLASVGQPKVQSEFASERQRRWVERFVQGINQYISSHSEKLPVEFSILEYRPEAFSIDDIRSVLLALAWESSVAVRIDPVLCGILTKRGKDEALRLFPGDPAVSREYVPAQLTGWDVKGALFSGPVDQPLRFPGLCGGCAWAVGPAWSRSGKPLIGCSINQSLSAPGFWYRVRLVARDLRLVGAFIPATPFAVAGNNGRVGWGCITTLADDADLFIEQVDSNAPNSYWRIDRWKQIQELKETYRVKDNAPVTRSILMTESGPLVSDVNDGRCLSLRWAGREGLGLFAAFYALNRARDGQEVRQALKSVAAPCLNVVWAEESGASGIQFAGRVPIRSPVSDGIIPMPGWTGAHDWGGYVPFHELPSARTPSGGASIVANERPGGPDYPFFMGCYWDGVGRSQRIGELLRLSGEHHRETFQTIQNDAFSPFAAQLVPVLLAALSGEKSNSPEAEAARILGSWDFQMTWESLGAAIFGLFYQALTQELVSERLDNTPGKGFTANSPLAERIVRRTLLENRAQWVSDQSTAPLMKRCFAKAVADGMSYMGSDLNQWKWGMIHRAEFRHPIAARSKLLETLYNVGPNALSGAGDTLDYADWTPRRPFQVTEAVSLKEIQDMTEAPQVFSVSPMGASAHFFSSHYKDRMDAWLNGRAAREPTELADIRQNAFSSVLFKAVPTTSVSWK